MCRGFAAGATVARIVRRRLQSGTGAEAALAAVDGGIEQFRQRGADRLHVGAMCFGFRGLCGLFGMVWIVRHGTNMG
jgi:hypothetical protein